jgi:hypothetical protein
LRDLADHYNMGDGLKNPFLDEETRAQPASAVTPLMTLIVANDDATVRITRRTADG